MSKLPEIVLASGSPRRRELLKALGMVFSVRPPRVTETREEGEPPESLVRRLSRQKARFEGHAGELVLAGDTVVVLGHEILGKPANDQEARNMLESLGGREHQVLTGVTLFEPQREAEVTEVATSTVYIRRLSGAEIDWYVASGEPRDKAGAYALQGAGGLFVERICGSASNVIGLPLSLTGRLFELLGWDITAFCRPPGTGESLDTLSIR